MLPRGRKNMGYKFTDLEKHYIAGVTWKKGCSFISQYVDESAPEDVWHMVQSSWTEEQMSEWESFDKILFSVWEWRTYQCCRLLMTEETTNRFFPTVPPEVKFKDVKESGFEKIDTFAIGMYASWFTRMPIKTEAPYDVMDDNEFERRKDMHDWEFGYVCKEAMDMTTFPREDIIEELGKQQQTIANIIQILSRSRDR